MPVPAPPPPAWTTATDAATTASASPTTGIALVFFLSLIPISLLRSLCRRELLLLLHDLHKVRAEHGRAEGRLAVEDGPRIVRERALRDVELTDQIRPAI